MSKGSRQVGKFRFFQFPGRLLQIFNRSINYESWRQKVHLATCKLFDEIDEVNRRRDDGYIILPTMKVSQEETKMT